MRTRIKLIIVAVIAIFVTGCGYSPADFQKGVVITSIKSTETGCLYYTKDHVWDGNHLWSEGYFYDDCGKFTVGDTVKIVKQ